MKKLLLQLIVTAGVGVAAAASCFAQSSHSYRANIPFDFTVDNVAMKAGDYRLNAAASNSDQKVITLQNVNDRKVKFLGIAPQGQAKAGRQAGNLQFTRGIGGYALANIDTPSFAVKLRPAKTNVKVVTKLEEKPEIVTVAIR